MLMHLLFYGLVRNINTSSNKQNISVFLLFFEFTTTCRLAINIGKDIIFFDNVPTTNVACFFNNVNLKQL